MSKKLYNDGEQNKIYIKKYKITKQSKTKYKKFCLVFKFVNFIQTKNDKVTCL